MPSIIKTVTLATFLIASLNLFSPAIVELGQGVEEAMTVETNSIDDEHFTISECNLRGPRPYVKAHLSLVLLTLLAFIGSRVKGLGGTFLTIVGLSGSSLVYLSWWSVAFRISDGAGIPISSIKHYGYLADGTVVDIFLAAIIAWLIVMQVFVSLQSFFSPAPRT